MKKIVLIIDEQSATGVIANVAAVLSMTIGYKIKELVGPDITDKSGFTHNGLTQLPIPVLGASSQKISEIINAVISMTDEDILLFDFNNFAQQAKTYEEYTSLIQTAMANDIVYLGIALYGNKKDYKQDYEWIIINKKQVIIMKVVVLDKENFLSDLPINGLDCEWVEYEKTDPNQILQHLKNADIAVTHRIRLDGNTLQYLPNLKMITTNSTGYETIDVRACNDLGITVCNIQDWCTNSVIEHIISFIFSLNRRQYAYHQSIKNKDWIPKTASSYAIIHTIPKEIYGSSVGIIGYGSLGRHLAETVTKLGMRPIIAERKNQKNARKNYILFNEVLKESDFIVLLAPLNKDTHYMISDIEIEMMKSSAFIINCGRGGLIDETALLKALVKNRIAGAALDVLEEEPPKLDNPLLNYQGNNLLLSSHVAFASQQSIARNSEMIIDNIRQFIKGEPINVVNSKI